MILCSKGIIGDSGAIHHTWQVWMVDANYLLPWDLHLHIYGDHIPLYRFSDLISNLLWSRPLQTHAKMLAFILVQVFWGCRVLIPDDNNKTGNAL